MNSTSSIQMSKSAPGLFTCHCMPKSLAGLMACGLGDPQSGSCLSFRHGNTKCCQASVSVDVRAEVIEAFLADATRLVGADVGNLEPDLAVAAGAFLGPERDALVLRGVVHGHRIHEVHAQGAKDDVAAGDATTGIGRVLRAIRTARDHGEGSARFACFWRDGRAVPLGEGVPVATAAAHNLGLIVAVLAVVDETVGAARGEILPGVPDGRGLPWHDAGRKQTKQEGHAPPQLGCLDDVFCVHDDSTRSTEWM
jgi:hypothetical protein